MASPVARKGKSNAKAKQNSAKRGLYSRALDEAELPDFESVQGFCQPILHNPQVVKRAEPQMSIYTAVGGMGYDKGAL